MGMGKDLKFWFDKILKMQFIILNFVFHIVLRRIFVCDGFVHREITIPMRGEWRARHRLAPIRFELNSIFKKLYIRQSSIFFFVFCYICHFFVSKASCKLVFHLHTQNLKIFIKQQNFKCLEYSFKTNKL
jgi:hypothetical protein